MDLIELRQLANKYIASRDDHEMIEWYATNLEFAEGELNEFMDWLESRAAHEVDERL